jgi:hypothetical protein
LSLAWFESGATKVFRGVRRVLEEKSLCAAFTKHERKKKGLKAEK